MKKTYTKHLKENPLKVIWIILVNAFVATMEVILISSKEIIIDDNNLIVYWGLHLFVLILFCVANYQPYKEYKDGL